MNKLPTNVFIAKAGKKGRGVFAKKNISRNSIIEISPFISIPFEDFSLIEKTSLNFYWYEVNSKTCAIGLGYTSLYNHAEEPNAEFIVCEKTQTIKIKAIKDISKNKEILINYGYDILSALKNK